MPLAIEAIQVLATGAAGCGVISLGLLWRKVRLQAASLNQQWQDRFEKLRADVARAEQSAVAAAETSSRSAAAAQSAVRAAEQAAQAAERSTLAASETTSAMRAVAESGKRAWVHPVDFRFTIKLQPGENSSMDVSIANLGTTPARELKVSTAFLLCDETPEDLPLKPRVFNVALGPGVSFSLSHFLRISQADLAGITTGRKVLLSCGRAEYHDVFDVARETCWCAAYDYNAKAFTAAGKHNKTI
jgi:hypothetical protein